MTAHKLVDSSENDDSPDDLTDGLMYAIYANAAAREVVSRNAGQVRRIMKARARSTSTHSGPDTDQSRTDRVNDTARHIIKSLADTANACAERAGYFTTLDDQTLTRIGSMAVSTPSGSEGSGRSPCNLVRRQLGPKSLESEDNFALGLAL